MLIKESNLLQEDMGVGQQKDCRTSSSLPPHQDLYPLPLPSECSPRPLSGSENIRVETLSRLQFFLATAPTQWSRPNDTSSISKFTLPNGESVSCVLWNGLYHITGTDIVRALAFRFEAFGRPVRVPKKWEEGVFSDLRNLKPGVDACLEEPKSSLLDFLFRNGCIRTQKKQKVFYWFSVPHDRLFLDALERDLKREKAGQEPTTYVSGEPARSFRYDPRRTLFEQFAGRNPGLRSSNQAEFVSTTPPVGPSLSDLAVAHTSSTALVDNRRNAVVAPDLTTFASPASATSAGTKRPLMNPSLFMGSPRYKQSRSRSVRHDSLPLHPDIGGISAVSHVPIRRKVVKHSRAWTAAPEVSCGNGQSSMPQQFIHDKGGSPVQAQATFRSYICPYDSCRRPFKRLEHLKRHARTHTNERPYQCGRCRRSFSRQDNLVQHSKTHEKMMQGHADAVDMISEPQFTAIGPSNNMLNTINASFLRNSEANYFTHQPLDHGHVLSAPLPHLRAVTAPPDWPYVLRSVKSAANSMASTTKPSASVDLTSFPASESRSITPMLTEDPAGLGDQGAIPLSQRAALHQVGGFDLLAGNPSAANYYGNRVTPIPRNSSDEFDSWTGRNAYFFI